MKRLALAALLTVLASPAPAQSMHDTRWLLEKCLGEGRDVAMCDTMVFGAVAGALSVQRYGTAFCPPKGYNDTRFAADLAGWLQADTSRLDLPAPVSIVRTLAAKYPCDGGESFTLEEVERAMQKDRKQ